MHVLGDYNSPVIPAVIYVPAKLSAFSKECYERGLAVSANGYGEFPTPPMMRKIWSIVAIDEKYSA